jgi:alpha-1,2-mannosyltransferase
MTAFVKSWLTEERLRIYPRAVLGAMTIGFALLLFSPDGVGTIEGDPGGDFRSFYTAGEIVRSGRAASLYDWSTQRSTQAEIAPGSTREFLPFAYPPFVALAYAPLSRLDFRLAYGLHTVGMALMVYLAVLLLVPVFRQIGSKPLAVFVALLAFYPMLRAVGGQTSAVGALLIALAWRCLHDERDLAAGVAIGFLLYKPQLALPLICLMGLLRRPRILVGFAGAAALVYAVGATVAGWSWIPEWWSQMGPFRQAQLDNSHQSIGILGFVEALIGVGRPAAIGIGGLLSVALAVVLVLTWIQARTPLNLRMGMTCCGLVLIPPHSLYYDAGIAGLGLLVLADERGWADARLLATLYLTAYLTPLAETVGFSPVFPLVVALLVRLRILS